MSLSWERKTETQGDGNRFKTCDFSRIFFHGVEEVARSNRVAPTRFCFPATLHAFHLHIRVFARLISNLAVHTLIAVADDFVNTICETFLEIVREATNLTSATVVTRQPSAEYDTVQFEQ